MASEGEIKQRAIDHLILLWLQKHSGKWWRIPDVAQAVNISVPAANCSLFRLTSSLIVIRESRKKRGNCKRYPVFLYNSYSVSSKGPSWMTPSPPSFTPEQIKGIRTVLGLTGDLRMKKNLQDEAKKS